MVSPLFLCCFSMDPFDTSNSQNCSMFLLAFVAWWLQGHWWGFISRNYIVWPIFFLMNVFIVLKGTHFWILFHVTRTFIKPWMSSNFRQIRLLTTELAALERLKHQCLHFFSVTIDPIFFKVGGYIHMHNILHGLEFWQNGTTDYGVSCPWASKKLMSPHLLGCYWSDPL